MTDREVIVDSAGKWFQLKFSFWELRTLEKQVNQDKNQEADTDVFCGFGLIVCHSLLRTSQVLFNLKVTWGRGRTDGSIAF